MSIIGNMTGAYFPTGSLIEIDETLALPGQAADAKATGDAISQLQANVDNVANIVNNLDDTHYTELEIDSIVAELNAVIDAKSDSDHIHDDLYYTETEIDGKLAVMQSDLDSKVDAEDGKGLFSDEEKEKLKNIEEHANFYEHPAHDSHDMGFYKVKVDASGHVSEATSVEKDDILAFIEKDDIVNLGFMDEDSVSSEISDVNNRIDSVEGGLNDAVSANTRAIEDNKSNIEAIQATVDEKADGNHNHDSDYDALGAAEGALDSAKEYADSIKDDLLNGAGEAYDTLKELGDLINDNKDALDALEIVATGKADKEHGHKIADVENLQSMLDKKSDDGHDHDLMYYTENEIDGKLNVMQSEINDKVNQEVFIAYVESNNSVVSDHGTRLDTIQGDYLKLADKTELKSEIEAVSGTAMANENAITILNGDETVDGSVRKIVDDTVNEFTTSQFTPLSDSVTGLGNNLSNYKTEVSERFTQFNNSIQEDLNLKSDKEHVHNDATTSTSGFMSAEDKATIEDLKDKVGDVSVEDRIDEALANIQTEKEVYVQSGEPVDVPDDTIWIDLNAEGSISSGNGVMISAGFVAQSEPPTDTSVMWVDTDDNSVDELPGAAEEEVIQNLSDQIVLNYPDNCRLQLASCYLYGKICTFTLQIIVDTAISDNYSFTLATLPVGPVDRVWINNETQFFMDQKPAGNIRVNDNHLSADNYILTGFFLIDG